LLYKHLPLLFGSSGHVGFPILKTSLFINTKYYAMCGSNDGHVTRKVTELLNIPTVDICDHIKQVLSEKERFHSYINTIKKDDGFETTVKPIGWPFILSTKMDITFVKHNEQTEVTVNTQSQWFILGDGFNAYNGYINKFLDGLRKYS
jgi:hypothetical protein